MVSEGVDIPRLAVGVFATTTTTELFFRQAVGRLVRWRRGSRRQQAFLYLPDDPRLRARAFQIADERRHSLRRKEDDDAAHERDDTALDEPDRPEQLSLFAAISAVATDHDDPGAPWDHDLATADDGEDKSHDDGDVGWGVLVEFGDPPPLAATPAAGGDPMLTRVEYKRRLRDFNAEAARELALVTGWQHAKINAELNRLAGVDKVSQATVEQLERRLRHAESWLRRA
jgi:superfamily II DNA or RNA helicase